MLSTQVDNPEIPAADPPGPGHRGRSGSEAAAGDPDADPEPAALTQGPRWYQGKARNLPGQPEPRRRSRPRSDPRSGNKRGDMMPTPIKSVNNINKHLSKAEIDAREKAEAAPTRKPRRPKQIADNKEALQHWKNTIKDLEGLEILDRADSDTLAAYCEILAHADALRADEEKLKELWENERDIKAYKALSTVRRDILTLRGQQLSYATKLGLTPEARARLAKRAAETDEEDPDSDLFA